METVLDVVPSDVAGVVAQLSDIQHILESWPSKREAESIAAFNLLYHAITSRVLQGLESHEFEDSEFLALLDLEFAKRYVEALRWWGRSDDRTPHCWSLVFDGRESFSAIQSAIAGVNAHINYDLAFAVVAALEKLKAEPAPDSRYEDYLRVNEIFHFVTPGLRARFYRADVWNAMADRINGPADDWFHDALVKSSRDLAWKSAVKIWSIKSDADALEDFRASLDRNVSILGKAIFVTGGTIFDPLLWSYLGGSSVENDTIGSISDVIESLRDEMTQVVKAAAGLKEDEVRFAVGPIEVEFVVEIERSKDGKLGFDFLVAAGGGFMRGDRRSHRVKLTLQPFSDGKMVTSMVTRVSDQPPVPGSLVAEAAP